MAQALMVAGTAMQFIGGMKQASAIKAQGRAQLQEAEYRAAQGRQIAGQQRATAQRAMIEENRKTRLAQSRSQAVAAAQGSGGDPSVLNLQAGIGAEGKYNALTALYEGDDRAQQLESGADLALYEGQSAYRAAKSEASAKRLETIGKTATSMFSMYAPTGSTSSGMTDSQWSSFLKRN